MYINQECVKDILSELHNQFASSTVNKIKPVRMKKVFSADSLQAYNPQDLLVAYNYILDNKFIEPKESFSYIKNRDPFTHYINRISTKGYIFMSAAEDKSFWSKIKSFADLDKLCTLIQSGAAIVEIYKNF